MTNPRGWTGWTVKLTIHGPDGRVKAETMLLDRLLVWRRFEYVVVVMVKDGVDQERAYALVSAKIAKLVERRRPHQRGEISVRMARMNGRPAGKVRGALYVDGVTCGQVSPADFPGSGE